MTRRFSSREAKRSLPEKKTKRQLESGEKKAREELHRRTICKHFVGGLDQECSLGINVRTLVGGPDLGWGRRRPCTPNSTLCNKDTMVPCEKYEANYEQYWEGPPQQPRKRKKSQKAKDQTIKLAKRTKSKRKGDTKKTYRSKKAARRRKS